VAHLQLLLEELVVGLPVAAAEAIPEGGELSIVEVEIQVVHGVASGAVDDRVVGNVFAVVDEHGPDVDEDEKRNVGELLEWEDEGKQMVRQALRISVKRVESVRCVRRRHDPLVVRLVEVLVDGFVV
jgi:hypothetical protein